MGQRLRIKKRKDGKAKKYKVRTRTVKKVSAKR